MINIITIATGNYKNFLNNFYNSFNELFCTDDSKNFYIFSDENKLDIFQKNNVYFSKIEHEKWPLPTFNKYKNIKKILDNLGDSDLCMFIDADMEIINCIKYIEIPENKKYIGVVHPGNHLTDMKDSLEDNINSAAYVNKDTLPINFKYIQGCLWGGIGKSFKKMVKELDNLTNQDKQKNYIPKWHDESILNKFKVDNVKDFGFLSSSFCYPENWNLNIKKIIIHKDKDSVNFPK
jgi:hypothetical protein